MSFSTARLAIRKARRHSTFENGLNQRFSGEPKKPQNKTFEYFVDYTYANFNY